ncbi:MAG: sigma 54-interacting transcriptional regulator, partial [Burkholderiales bacterium]
ALHRHSPRALKPFIAINTAAIPKDLLESELFGHERGAFTGAQSARSGRFEQANDGTLFLDEIGDMPLDLQTRLLRVLSEGQFYRVGGHQSIRVDVRVIAATHQDLESSVKQGAFREDLFHRLNVIRLRLPALRERSEDIPLLVKHFLQKSAQTLGMEPKALSAAALRYLTSLSWGGNVRQVENVCHWLTVMTPGQNIDIGDLPPELREPGVQDAETSWQQSLARHVRGALNRGEHGILQELAKEFEKILIIKALEHSAGRRIEAANLLGLGRNTLTRKINELGIGDDSEDTPARRSN